MKQLVIIFILLIFYTFSLDAQSRKKVGVVLSGGGAKGVAHVGALKVIEEAGIPIDIIVGTSMGSIVGGLYSIGYTPQQLDSMVKAQDWSFTLTDRVKRQQKTFIEKVEAEKYVISVPFRQRPKEISLDGFVKGANLHELFTDLTAGYHDSIDFTKLPIPFACVAVDIIEGREEVFYKGNLMEAMRASMAIPAVFTPVRINDMVLIDGGILNNYPVDVARRMGAEVIIGIDVHSGPDLKNKMDNLMDLMNKITDMAGKEKYVRNLYDTDLYIKVDVKGFTSASFEATALDTLMTRGEYAARSAWNKLIALKKVIGVESDYTPPSHGPYNMLTKENPLFVRNVSFPTLNKKDAERVMKKSNLHENSFVTMKTIKNTINNLYALQNYTNIDYVFHKTDEGYDLEFRFEERKPHSLNLGIRLDTEEVATVQLNASYQLNTPIPSRVIITGRLGKRASAKLDYLIQPSKHRFVNLSYLYEYNDINLYYRGEREFNTTFSFHQIDLGYTNILSRNTKFGFGVKYEYFDYNSFLFNKIENEYQVKPEGFFDYYALVQRETKDKKSFPNRGSSLQAELNIYTDNLSTYNEHAPFGTISLWWERALPVTRRFTILPAFYGRVVFGHNSAYSYMNVIGGDQPGRYMPQQLPFIGVGYMEATENSMLIARTEFRQRMGKRNYLSVYTNYGLTKNNLKDIINGTSLFGWGIGYGYESFLGPIEATFTFSNRTKEVGFYANVGFFF